MRKAIAKLTIVALIGVLMTSCFGQHNNAPNEGVNLTSERIYGDLGGEPKQLNNEYPDGDLGATAQRIQSIRQKLFPK